MHKIRKAMLAKIRLGDKVESFSKLVGADKAALKYEQITGKPCGCEERKAFLNGE